MDNLFELCTIDRLFIYLFLKELKSVEKTLSGDINLEKDFHTKYISQDNFMFLLFFFFAQGR